MTLTVAPKFMVIAAEADDDDAALQFRSCASAFSTESNLATLQISQ